MSTEITILKEQVERRRWLTTSYNTTKKSTPNSVILYIGNNDAPKNISNSISLRVKAKDLVDALEQIKGLENFASNDVNLIIIDLQAGVAELEKLHFFFKSNLHCHIICNSQKLYKSSAKFLLHFGLIDDVVDLRHAEFEELLKIAATAKREERARLYPRVKQMILHGKDKRRDFSFLLKKVFDITIAAFIILVLSPIFILISIAIRLDSRGPIFYSSPRAGRGYRIFKFYKFRSMVVDADKKIETLAHLNQYNVTQNGPNFFKLSNDPRVTRVGRFLRNTSLDELPQLFNVLKGDMSLVGNRPLPLYEAATLTTNEYVERFTAPAGMTGFWQIKKRGKAEMSIKERMDLDITYARKASPLFDLYILANTPAALFQKSDV